MKSFDTTSHHLDCMSDSRRWQEGLDQAHKTGQARGWHIYYEAVLERIQEQKSRLNQEIQQVKSRIDMTTSFSRSYDPSQFSGSHDMFQLAMQQTYIKMSANTMRVQQAQKKDMQGIEKYHGELLKREQQLSSYNNSIKNAEEQWKERQYLEKIKMEELAVAKANDEFKQQEEKQPNDEFQQLKAKMKEQGDEIIHLKQKSKMHEEILFNAIGNQIEQQKNNNDNSDSEEDEKKDEENNEADNNEFVNLGDANHNQNGIHPEYNPELAGVTVEPECRMQ